MAVLQSIDQIDTACQEGAAAGLTAQCDGFVPCLRPVQGKGGNVPPGAQPNQHWRFLYDCLGSQRSIASPMPNAGWPVSGSATRGDHSAFDAYRQALERFAGAGAAHAISVAGVEQGAMSGALQ